MLPTPRSVRLRAAWYAPSVLAALLTSGCVLVLDLDAEGAVGGGEASGGGAAGGGQADAAGTATTAAGAGNGGGASCADGGFARFDGAQFFGLDNDSDDALDFEDDFSIGARVRPDLDAVQPDGDTHVAVLLSRLLAGEQKGYSLYLIESNDGGVVYPEFRAFVASSSCACTGPTPLASGAWVSLAGSYKKGAGLEDLALFVDGARVCTADCGDAKLSTFDGRAAIGSAVDGNGGYFVGDLDDVFAKQRNDGEPPTECGGDTRLLLRFEEAREQVFEPDCTSDGINATFGASSSPDTADPLIVICP